MQAPATTHSPRRRVVVTLDAPELLTRLFELEHGSQVIDGIASASQAVSSVPRATYYVHDGGHILIVRRGLPAVVHSELEALEPQRAITAPGLVASILEQHGPCEEVYSRTVHVFTHVPDVDGPVARSQDGRWCVQVDGQIVSEAWSAAENELAASVRVDTLRAFRGRGLAGNVVAAWVHQILESGRTPFYTHAIDNHASAALARKLGAVEIARGVKCL